MDLAAYVGILFRYPVPSSTLQSHQYYVEYVLFMYIFKHPTLLSSYLVQQQMT